MGAGTHHNCCVPLPGTGDFAWVPLNGFCNEAQKASPTAHLEPAETAKQNKKLPEFFFKLFIRTKVQAVSSGLFCLKANENLLLAKLFLIFYK